MLNQPEPARDQFGRYKLKTPDGGVKSFQRVTTFASKISDTYNISRWQQRNVAIGLAKKRDLYAMIPSFKDPHGQQKDKFHEAVVDKAIDASGAHEGANLGTSLHDFTAEYDMGHPVDILPPFDRDVEIYAETLRNLGIKVFPSWVERVVSLDDIRVAGTFDRIVEYDGQFYIADLKTGKEPAKYPHEICVQLACYANADTLHSYNWETQEWDRGEMPEVNKDRALVMHMRPGSATTDLYWFDIRAGWDAAQVILEAIAWNKKRGLVSNWDGSKFNASSAKTITKEAPPAELAPEGEGCKVCGAVVSTGFQTLAQAKFGQILCQKHYAEKQRA